VEYRSHHKHSQTIIRHADLPGWTVRQVELVAAMARYHRRALPSVEHEEFEALSEPDRQLVRRLAALLRVADGLDRAHAQAVRGVRVRFGKEGVTLEATAEAEPTVDLKAARKKSDLLGEVSGVSVEYGLEKATPKPRKSAERPAGALA
jgi:exopolyphosphatase/guanosine-5'-triphosphate,3'-diphosphate pyrophosphatase